MNPTVTHPRILWLSVVMSVCCLAGCEPKREARVYIAPKTETEFVVAPPTRPNSAAPFLSGTGAGSGAGPMPGMSQSSIPFENKRILGAIFPLHGGAFFLKFTDTIDRIEAVKSVFPSIVAEFQADPATSLPTCKFPDGWEILPGDTFTAAKVSIPAGEGQKPLIMTVSRLEAPPEPAAWEGYLEPQLNRWRGQLQLPNLPISEIMTSLVSVPRSGSEIPAYIFDMNGSSGGAASPSTTASEPRVSPVVPPAANPSSPPASTTESTRSAAAAPSQPRVVFEKPETWEELPATPFRLVSFRIPKGDGQQTDGEIAVSMALDSPLENCRLWSKQVLQSEETSAIESLAERAVAEAEEIPAGERIAKLYSIRSTDAADAACLLIAVIPTDKPDIAVFVKLRSDLRMSEEQKSNLLRFVKTLRWE